MVLNIRFEDDIIKLPNKRSGYMQKTSYISCPISDCRARLSNVGIGYTDLGDDVYKFNSVQKKGDSFSFYATVTLRASGMDGTDVSVDLMPDSADEFTPENVNEIYDKFMSKFFKALSEPKVDGFDAFGSSSSDTFPSGESKFCSHCGAKIDKKAVVCPKCGCSQKRDYMEDKTSAVGIAAIIFAVLGGWLGLILSLFGLLFYYKDSDSPVSIKGMKNCKIALGIVIAWVVLAVLIYLISFAMVGLAAAGSGL